MENLFGFLGFYLMPVLGYLFIVALLRAVKKIVKNQPYGYELFWSGLLFGLIVWTITIFSLLNY